MTPDTLPAGPYASRIRIIATGILAPVLAVTTVVRAP
jgi:hypothetical protein